MVFSDVINFYHQLTLNRLTGVTLFNGTVNNGTVQFHMVRTVSLVPLAECKASVLLLSVPFWPA